MSERAPRVTAREIIRVLERRGFILARSSGSHHIYKNAGGRRVGSCSCPCGSHSVALGCGAPCGGS